MIDLVICGIETAKEILQGEHDFTALVSILDPGVPPVEGDIPNRLHISAYDDPEPSSHYAPTREHVLSLVDFAGSLEDSDKILVHCMSGASRSPAAAWIILGSRDGFKDPDGTLDRVLEAQPEAYPNRAMLTHADQLFGVTFLETLQRRDL
jgi:predicted protein tyrosine phosphatase